MRRTSTAWSRRTWIRIRFRPYCFETLLSKVEAWGKEFIDAAVADPGFVIDDELRARFSRYMGFQYVRGRSARWFAEAAANDLIKIKYEDVTDDGIRNMLAENGEVTDRQIGRFREFLDGCVQWKDQDHAARAAMVDTPVESLPRRRRQRWPCRR